MANRILFYDMTDWARLWYNTTFNPQTQTREVMLDGDVDIQCSFAEHLDTIRNTLGLDIAMRELPTEPVFMQDAGLCLKSCYMDSRREAGDPDYHYAIEAIMRRDDVCRGFVAEIDATDDWGPRLRRLTQEEWNAYMDAHGERWKATMMDRAGIRHDVLDERGNRRPEADL